MYRTWITKDNKYRIYLSRQVVFRSDCSEIQGFLWFFCDFPGHIPQIFLKSAVFTENRRFLWFSEKNWCVPLGSFVWTENFSKKKKIIFKPKFAGNLQKLQILAEIHGFCGFLWFLGGFWPWKPQKNTEICKTTGFCQKPWISRKVVRFWFRPVIK